MALITPQGAPDYVAQINSLLSRLRSNPVGDIILSGIAKPVFIIPVAYRGLGKNGKSSPQESATDHCEASVVPADSDAARVKLKKQGEPGFDERRDQCYTSNPHNRFAKKENCAPTGLGSAATLFYTPGEHGSCPSNRKRPGRSDAESIVIHELVHCLRITQGLIRAVPTTEQQFVNEEEFLAITIANVYKSARDGAKAVLDHSHAANDVAGGADPDFDTSAGFLDEPDNHRVLAFHAGWDVFKKLAKVNLQKGGRPQALIFNPFAEFEKREQAKKEKKAAPAKR